MLARWARRLSAPLAGLLGGVLASGAARAIDLPEDRAEAMFHVYDGGGVRATGPALLVRKSLADRVSLSGSYYVDMVSNASIDVVTTASPYDEKRSAYEVGLDYAVRDSLISVSVATSREPDYNADGFGVDVSHEVFGGMTTVSLGFSRGSDEVGQRDVGFFDSATHWQYRLGVTQILSPTWLMSANFEAVSDDGFLGSPYRAARVFGAAVPERNPRTRTSRAVKLRSLSAFGPSGAVRAEYRYFWDTWDITAHTLEAGYSRYVQQVWLADGFVRLYSQDRALFYSDNAQQETTFVSRNRQLSTFKSTSVGVKLTYTAGRVMGRYDMKLKGAFERVSYRFSDFTDIRNGKPYRFDANVLQVLVSATF